MFSLYGHLSLRRALSVEVSPPLFLFRLSETLCAVLRGWEERGWVGGGLRTDSRSQERLALPVSGCQGAGWTCARVEELLRGHGVSLCVPFSPSRAESVPPVEGERNAEGLLLAC